MSFPINIYHMVREVGKGGLSNLSRIVGTSRGPLGRHWHSILCRDALHPASCLHTETFEMHKLSTWVIFRFWCINFRVGVGNVKFFDASIPYNFPPCFVIALDEREGDKNFSAIGLAE